MSSKTLLKVLLKIFSMAFSVTGIVSNVGFIAYTITILASGIKVGCGFSFFCIGVPFLSLIMGIIARILSQSLPPTGPERRLAKICIVLGILGFLWGFVMPNFVMVASTNT